LQIRENIPSVVQDRRSVRWDQGQDGAKLKNNFKTTRLLEWEKTMKFGF